MRSLRERIVQTLAFEVIGLAVIAPLYRVASGASIGDAVIVILAVSIVAAGWSGAFNAAFDHVEYRLLRRLASDRPHRLRLLQTVGRELTEVPLTCPVIFALTDLTFAQALTADIGLAVAYMAYGYVFHLVFDLLRPVQAIRARSECRACRVCPPDFALPKASPCASACSQKERVNARASSYSRRSSS